MWIVLFVVGLVGTYASVLDLFQQYFEYKVVTSVEVKRQEAIDFPSMTFCNMNRVHCGKLLKLIVECEDSVSIEGRK